MNAANENVMVVDRALLERLGMFQGLTLDVEHYLKVLLDSRNYRFVARPEAEQNPLLKQLIPYFLIVHDGRVFTYTRGKQSGESRLVAKVSMGIGGHINHLDDSLFGDLYARAARRELEEEVELPPGCTDRIVALLNDDATPVGRVHLGVIHVLRAPTDAVRNRERMIADSGFRMRDELMTLRPRMETWSQICLDHLESWI